VGLVGGEAEDLVGRRLALARRGRVDGLDDVERLPAVAAGTDDHEPHAPSPASGSGSATASGSSTGWPSAPLPARRTDAVASTIPASTTTDWVRTYSTSCSIRSDQLSALRPRTWASPVRPGRTHRRRRWWSE